MAELKKYKVLLGRHCESKLIDGVETDVTYYKGGPAGDIFESSKDILKFNVKGFPPKFAAVTDLVKEAVQPDRGSSSSSDGLDKDLLAMSPEELRSFAKEAEVDISGVRKKEDIIRLIQEKVNA